MGDSMAAGDTFGRRPPDRAVVVVDLVRVATVIEPEPLPEANGQVTS